MLKWHLEKNEPGSGQEEEHLINCPQWDRYLTKAKGTIFINFMYRSKHSTAYGIVGIVWRMIQNAGIPEQLGLSNC